MFVGGLEVFPTGKGGSKHEDGGFWCMKISDKCVDGLKFKAWVDENIIFAFSFAGFGPIFKRARNGGADGYNAVTFGFGFFDSFESVVGNMEPLGVHVVIFDIVATNRKEGAKSDVESKIFDLNVFGLKFFDEFFGHIETGGWGSGGAKLFSPNGLITLNVVLVSVTVEVWRKWNVAVIGDNLSEVAVGGDGSSAITKDLFNDDGVVSFVAIGDVFDSELIAGMKFAAIHDVIDLAVVFFEYDELAGATVGQFSKNTRAHDASVV